MIHKNTVYCIWIRSELLNHKIKKAGLKHIRFHDLRHSCASLMINQGVPLRQIQEWLGHSDIGTTSNIYAHLDSSAKVRSAGVLDAVLKTPECQKVGW